MATNVLELSRAERGELKVHKVLIDLCEEVVRPCVELFGPLFVSRVKNVQVRCPEGIRAQVDPELLKIALGDYLSNAAKYGKEGGRAEVLVDAAGDRVTVEVWNQSPGFSKSDADRLFKKFSRVRDATTRGTRGSGLGLSITKDIMDLHSGQVRAEAEVSSWARFSLSFSFPTPSPPS